MASENSRSLLPILGIVVIGGVFALKYYNSPQFREDERKEGEARYLASDKKRMEVLTQPLKEAQTLFEGFADEASVRKAEPELNKLYLKLIDLSAQPLSVQEPQHVLHIAVEADSLRRECFRVEQKVPAVQELTRKWRELAENFTTKAEDHLKQTHPTSYETLERLKKKPLGLFQPNKGKEEDVPEARRHFEKAGGFSFVPPFKWRARAEPKEEFDVIVPDDLRPGEPRIFVKEMPFEGSLKDLVIHIKLDFKKLKNSRVIKEADFTTTAGLSGVRLIFEHEDDDLENTVSRVNLFFFGAAKMKYMVICTALFTKGGNHDLFDPDFERAMKTFRFEKP